MKAEALIGAACLTFADVWVDTVTEGGKYTREEGVEEIATAADGAEMAADRDERWRPLARDFQDLAQGMETRNDGLISESLQAVHEGCDPVLEEHGGGRN